MQRNNQITSNYEQVNNIEVTLEVRKTWDHNRCHYACKGMEVQRKKSHEQHRVEPLLIPEVNELQEVSE
ncbi:hypothetical protein [Chitinophaga flava]|uniref:Uncharacterized protein n=1 Tax=Chitinophaga flava TaxID=2259036 RepID=A0A365Y7I7_9BACT|nr:hypothetical protein [Chitinophaga flava]RBL93865.1 hypothetical protein DF182_15340 [Chitinophaga flava]